MHVTKWRAIVFDLDDTLYAERQYVISGMRAVADWAHRELGLSARRSFAELRALFHAGVRGDTFDRWLASHGLNHHGRVAAIVQVYRAHRPRITLRDGVRRLLERLRRTHRLGLVTDGPLAVQRQKVAALQLQPLIHATVFSDTWGRAAWKPSVRPFLAVLDRLSIRGSEAVYVGDNPTKDFRGPRQLGMETIRVRRADGLYRDLEPPSVEYAPDMEIARVEELADLAGLRSRTAAALSADSCLKNS